MPEYIQNTRNFFQSNKRLIFIIFGIILIVLLAFLFIYLLRSSRKTGQGLIGSRRGNTKQTTLQKPIYPLPSGKQVYRFSHGPNVVGPKPEVVTIDPFTPIKGQTQNFSVTIKNGSPVTQASIYLITDNGQTNYPLKLVSGTDTDGTWQASWTMKDTYNYIYRIKFDLRSKTGNYFGEMNFRQWDSI